MNQNLIVFKVLPQFFLTLLISFIGMVVGMMFLPKAIAFPIMITVLVFLIIAAFVKNKNKGSAFGMRLPLGLVHIITFLMGIGVYPTVSHYLSQMGATLVLVAFGITAALFGSLFLYALITRRDFTFLGGMLFFALIALILVSIVAIFVQIEMLHLVLAWAGVLIFSGFILYDVSKMKSAHFTEADVGSAVFNLYLNFINIFMDMLRIVSHFTSND